MSNQNFKTLESLKPVEKVIAEAGMAVSSKSRTIETSAIPEVLGGVAGAGAGAAGSFVALYMLGTVGLSAAGITSGLAAAGAIVGGGMVAGIGVLAAPVALLTVAGYGVLAHRKHKKLLQAKEELLMRISTDTYLLTIEDFCEKNQLEITEKDEVYQVLLYACALLMRNKLETTESTLEDMNYEYQEYIHAIRPDMLKLYELFHEKKRIKSNSIRIEYNNEVINLDNFDNWFMNMITPYLDKYLGVSSLEEAQEELDRDYPNKGKRGRKKSNPVFDFILWRASKILELSSFATPNVQINKSQADFLLKYLNFLGLLEEDMSSTVQTRQDRAGKFFETGGRTQAIWS